MLSKYEGQLGFSARYYSDCNISEFNPAFFLKSHLFSTKFICLHSFPRHPLFPLSLGSCAGTPNCFLHCIRITANFLFFSRHLFVKFQFAYAKTKAPMTLQHISYDIPFVPIVLAEALLMDSENHKSRAAILSDPMRCMQHREDLCSCTSVHKSYAVVSSRRNRKSAQ